MEPRLKNYLGITVMAVLIVGALGGLWYVRGFWASIAPTRSFSVSGEGKAVAVPDVAELSFGVLTEGGKDLANLQKENTQKVNRVIGFLKEEDIAAKDIKTQFYSIQPRYQYFTCPPPLRGESARPCPPSEIVGYSISQTVQVKIRDLNKTGDILSGVVERGTNTVSGPVFTVDDPIKLENQAREEAMKEAREKAAAIAKAGGFRLGRLIGVGETPSFPPPRILGLEKGGFGGDIAAAPSIEPGSQEIRVNVTLTYEIR